MTAEAQQDQPNTDDENSQARQQSDQAEAPSGNRQSRNQNGASGAGRSGQSGRSTAVQRRSDRPGYMYDPQGAARAGLINLATTWRDSGATYQAISVYTEVLTRYPGSSAAAAATEGLVEMARNLQQQGRFYTALSILRKLEDLA